MISLLKEAIEGTDLYYATLYFPKNVREVLCAIEIARREITSIPQKINDDGVAHLKLSWWWDEVARFELGKPRHPLLEIIKDHRVNPLELSEKLHSLIENIMREMRTSSLTKKDDMLHKIQSLNEPIFDHLIKICGHETDDDYGLMLELACLNELANQILSLKLKTKTTLLGVSRNAELSNDGLSSTGTCADFSSALISAACQDLSATLSRCPKGLQRRQRFFSTLARINELVLKLTLKTKPYEQKRIELLPVKKLWVSWRINFFL